MRHTSLTLMILSVAVAGCEHAGVVGHAATAAAPPARCSLPSELAVDCNCTTPDCLLELGYIYSEAIDVTRDDRRGRRLFERACAGGSTIGCNDLASLLVEGRGGPADAARAADLYEAACHRGNAAACANLGTLYLDGRGRARDDLVAGLLYGQACKAGLTHACAALAMLYVRGDGVPVDVGQAITLFEDACTHGDATACGALTVIAGAGSVSGIESYIRGLHQSCETGDGDACFRLR